MYFCGVIRKLLAEMENFEDRLKNIVEKYWDNFNQKSYGQESEETDVLMEAFGISQEIKQENKQYWGRELGMCWQLLVTEVFQHFCDNFSPAQKFGADEPVDLFVGLEAIDTKYRVGSGDSGTLKKFKQYGKMLEEKGFTPVLLFLRTDNLPAAINACESGGWNIYMGDESFQFIEQRTGFNLKDWLLELKENGDFFINR